MPYSPAFQFYPKDYLGDKNTIPMNTVEHGAYCLLWMHCWQEDGLTDDIQELADMAKLSIEDFTPIWERRIKKCFIWDDKKKLFFHPRLLKEIKKQKSWKKENSERGRKAALSRWHPTVSDDASAMHTHADAMQADASSSSFSFSFPISELNLKRLIERAISENSDKNAHLIEVAVIQTLISRNGSKEKINSMKYFEPEIKKMQSTSDKLLESIIEKRRQQLKEWQQNQKTPR